MREKVLKVAIDRHVFETKRDFPDVLEGIYTGISRPNIETLFERLATSPDYADFAARVTRAAGSAGLMRFLHLNLDAAVTLATNGTVTRRLVRLIAGNPVTMAEMTRTLGDAGSYAPVTILIEQTAAGTRVAYDSVCSALAGYSDYEAAKMTAARLDTEVLTLLRWATSEQQIDPTEASSGEQG